MTGCFAMTYTIHGLCSIFTSCSNDSCVFEEDFNATSYVRLCNDGNG